MFHENIKNILLDNISIINKNNPIIKTELSENLDKICNLLKKSENTKPLLFETNNKKVLFIKLHEKELKQRELEELERKAHSLYAKKDYQNLLEIVYKLIIKTEIPKPFYYRMAAFANLNLGYKEEAIKYFIIAEEASKTKKDKYSFKSLIKKLEQK